MLASVPLDGSWHEPGTTVGPLPDPEISHFLDEHPTAKIIVVVDTHCLQETGGFIWCGTGPESYRSCGLYDVSEMDSIRFCEFR